MPWVTELGLSARVLEGCALEPKIQDPNHTGNDQNTGIMFSLYLFLVFLFFSDTILYNTIVLQINGKKGRVFCFDKSGIRQQVSTKEDSYNTKTKIISQWSQKDNYIDFVVAWVIQE